MDPLTVTLILGLLGTNGIWGFFQLKSYRAANKQAEAKAGQEETTEKSQKATYDEDSLDKYERLATRTRELLDQAMKDHQENITLVAEKAAQKIIISDQKGTISAIYIEQGAAQEREKVCQKELRLIKEKLAQAGL